MLKIIDTENMRWQKLYDIDETGTQMVVNALPLEEIEKAEELVLCANCGDRGNPEECPLLKDMGVTFSDDYCCYGYRDDADEEGGGAIENL